MASAQVAAPEPVIKRARHRTLDPRGLRLAAQTVARHHRGGQDRRHRVRLALPGDIGRAAVDRFIKPEGAEFGLAFAQRCTCQKPDGANAHARLIRSEEHTSELQSLMRISYAVFCLKKKK